MKARFVFLALTLLASACFGTHALARGDEHDCTEAPVYEIFPSGPIQIQFGESASFEVCGESLCEGDIFIEGINLPDWCSNLRGGNEESCSEYTCEPPDTGTYTLRFQMIDDETGMTSECSVTIQVNGSECMAPPLCTIDPAGPVKILLGESVEFEVCGQSLCDTFVDIEAVNPPKWCESKPQRSGGEEVCIAVRCTPPAGMFELQFRVTDDNNMSTTCSIMIEVNEPCDNNPMCSIMPTGPLKVEVGNSVEFEVCGSSGCDNTVTISSVNGVPAWCTEINPRGFSNCKRYRCTPTDNDTGMHTLEFQVRDDENDQTTTCSITIEVNEPCVLPPTCRFSPEGPLMAYVGEEFTFEACGESQCENPSTITALNLPDWCVSTHGRSDNEACLTVTCTPPNNVEGMYTFEFEVEDTENGQKTTCSIDVEVVCHLEPMCFFTEDGPFTFAVGEEIDFEFGGVASCDGHRARIEMSSRPPFIDPAGHQKGGVDEEIRLPVTGTPGPGDVGTWRLRVTVRDLDSGVESECEILIIVTGPEQCAERPVCSIDPEEAQIVLPGDSVTLEVCGASLCDDGTVMIELFNPPSFCDLFETAVSEPGEEVCAELLCVLPDDVEPGDYLVRFRITDLENNKFRFCSTTIVVPEPPVLSFCVEEEPNDDFTTCTLLDANDCLDLGCGSNVVGLLSLNGVDLDFYCLSGLEPFTDYLVTVVGGLDCDGAPVCAALACLDNNGGIINSTNSGGVMMGYPSINCLSDANGFIQVAVSGCDDLDFDGEADNPDVEGLGGIGHGSTGSYQLTVVPINFDVVGTPCHADMNNDGVVDSGDLGMLLGVFGEICAP